MSNTLGNKLRVTVFGQSHAPAIGAVIEGLPAGFTPDMEAVAAFMRRRAPGRDATATARREEDAVEVIAGLNERGRPAARRWSASSAIRTRAAAITRTSTAPRAPVTPTSRHGRSSAMRATCAAAGSSPAASPRLCALPARWPNNC